jgi:hypothetical protein
MLILILLAIIASLYHILDEIRDVKSKIELAGKTFSFREHVQRNCIAWVVTIIGIVIMALLHYIFRSDIPNTLSFRVSMAALYLAGGYGGSAVFTRWFSTSQDRVTEVINSAIQNKIDLK